MLLNRPVFVQLPYTDCFSQQITGELPPETPLKQGEPAPQVRRRMGTSFELSSNRVDSESLTQEEKNLADLELHYE